jgi:peptidoglycan/xylan/chitin deacetylase (PgdA/CDA1 family)
LARRSLRLPWAIALNLCLRLTSRKAGVALLYHRIGARQGDPRRELNPHLHRSSFRRQLGHLRRRYRVVDSGAFLAAVARRRRGGRFPACITFDDDAREHVEHAMPELRRQGVTATFFLGGERSDSPWWDRLQRAFDSDRNPQEIASAVTPPTEPGERSGPAKPGIHELAAAIEALEPAERDRVSDRLLHVAGPDHAPPCLRSADVGALAGAGFRIGFHTRRHDPLPPLDDRELAQALSDGRDELERLSGGRIETIAYPHGRADRRVADAARSAGFRVGFTTEREAASPADDPLLLGRFEWRDNSLGAFALELVRTLRRVPG